MHTIILLVAVVLALEGALAREALTQTVADPHQSTTNHSDRGYQHSFGHAETWAKEFDYPARDTW